MPDVIYIDGQRREGGGGMQTILLLGVLGAAGYLVWKYVLADGGNGGNGTKECTPFIDPPKCIGGVMNECGYDFKYHPMEPTITCLLECEICRANYDCTSSFATPDELNLHIALCHPGAPGDITVWWENPDLVAQPYGWKQVDYHFCRPYFVDFVSGSFYLNLDKQPNPSQVWLSLYGLPPGLDPTVKANWLPLGINQVDDSGYGSLQITPAMALAAIRFEGHCDGFWCMAYDPGIKRVNPNFRVNYLSQYEPADCSGQTFGWKWRTW